jgi:hypothetical protein
MKMARVVVLPSGVAGPHKTARTQMDHRKRRVSLVFRGFEVDPSTIEASLGLTASSSGQRGKPVKPGVEAILRRSFVCYCIELGVDARLDQMIAAMIDHLGGVARIAEARDQAAVELLQLDIMLPVKGSEEQEGGLIPIESLNDLSHLGCSLSFQFV